MAATPHFWWVMMLIFLYSCLQFNPEEKTQLIHHQVCKASCKLCIFVPESYSVLCHTDCDQCCISALQYFRHIWSHSQTPSTDGSLAHVVFHQNHLHIVSTSLHRGSAANWMVQSDSVPCCITNYSIGCLILDGYSKVLHQVFTTHRFIFFKQANVSS